MATRDRARTTVAAVGEQRVDRARRTGAAFEGLCALHLVPTQIGIPSHVGRRRQQVDLLPGVLADVTDPQIVGLAVEREAPGVAHSVEVDLGGTPVVGEGVARRDLVRLVGVDLDAQDRSQERGGVLTVAVGVARAAPVAQPDVQEAVGAEPDGATVVVAGRLRDAEDLLAGVVVDRGAGG